MIKYFYQKIEYVILICHQSPIEFVTNHLSTMDNFSDDMRSVLISTHSVLIHISILEKCTHKSVKDCILNILTRMNTISDARIIGEYNDIFEALLTLLGKMYVVEPRGYDVNIYREVIHIYKIIQKWKMWIKDDLRVLETFLQQLGYTKCI